MLYVVEMDIGLGDMDEPQQQLFDCCICSQCTPSTSERLVGLVTLLQPSSGTLYMACILLVTVVIFTCAFSVSLFSTSSCWELANFNILLDFTLKSNI